jgi:methyl-accepting chemotaxis protein
VQRTNAGARLATGAGETMVEIVASVNRVSQLIGEIATAASEQSYEAPAPAQTPAPRMALATGHGMDDGTEF